MLISAVDTYFRHMAQRLLTNNAQVAINGAVVSQPIGIVSNAQDWPQIKPVEGAVYLLVLDQQPVQKQMSKVQVYYEYILQWVWILIGTDIPPDSQAANRGDNYRSNAQIQENLFQANFPGFTQEYDFVGNGDGTVTATPTVTAYPVSPVSIVRWSELRFMPKGNQGAGVVYGAAAVELYAYADRLASVI